MRAIEDFLNPTSMLTPGIAGGLTMAVSIPLSFSFGLKMKWIILVVSFLFGLLVTYSVKEHMARVQKCVYCVLNTLIVFSIAIGGAFTVDPPPAPEQPGMPPELVEVLEKVLASQPTQPTSSLFGISAAFAQENTGEAETPSEVRPEREEAPAVRPSEQITLDKKELDALKQYLEQQKKREEQEKSYQQRWSW